MNLKGDGSASKRVGPEVRTERSASNHAWNATTCIAIDCPSFEVLSGPGRVPVDQAFRRPQQICHLRSLFKSTQIDQDLLCTANSLSLVYSSDDLKFLFCHQFMHKRRPHVRRNSAKALQQEEITSSESALPMTEPVNAQKLCLASVYQPSVNRKLLNVKPSG